MADKTTALSIVIRTVDEATAKINAITKRLDAATRPTRELGKAFSKLRESSGFDAVVDGFKGVGGAVTDALGKVALVGGAVGVAVAGVMSLIDHFDKLGDTAEQLGTSADFLAAFRFAAERAGAPIEGVDEALQTLVTNMGAAKAGTGKMIKFLNTISPALAKQVTAANSLEEALGLLADAEAKLPDTARRAKLAAATLGDPKLAPLLARGSKGVQELLTKYAELAGTQGDAAEAAGKTDDALKNMHAATDGVKAAIVTGLAPALTTVIEKITTWLVGHREDVKRWAEDIGKKLPGAVDDVVKAIGRAIDKVSWLIDKFGGANLVIAALATVIAGPLVLSLASLAVALVANPFGLIVVGAAAAVAAIAELVLVLKTFHDSGGPRSSKSFDAQEQVMASGALPGGNEHVPSAVESKLMASGAIPKSRRFALGEGRANAIAREASANIEETRSADAERAKLHPLPEGPASLRAFAFDSPPPAQATIKVDFMNVPRNTRVTADPRNTADVDLSVGHQMFGAGS